MDFRPDKVGSFRLTGFVADPRAHSAVLRYSLDDTLHFEEHVRFGGKGTTALPPAHLSSGLRSGFERCVRLLHLVAGVSYYKTAAPKRIVVETGKLTDAESRLCHDLYDRGLREFAYRNELRIPRDLEISSQSNSSEAGNPRADAPSKGIAVPVGGGKDSIVVLEALRDLDPVLVSVNPNQASRRIVSISGCKLLAVRRELDPLLFDLNARGALNGHVPVTAIVSLISVTGGYLFGYDTTAMALESSADAPTRVVAGGHDRAEAVDHDVNHQWSKSAEFESLLQEVLRESVHPALRYLSPLRRFNELEITKAFATLGAYHSAFRSCNGVARLSGASDRWCADCPKCRFVFLALATALDRRSVVSIFGADMLDDPRQLQGFADMLDRKTKPFECVGTVEEVEAAMSWLFLEGEWEGAAVVEGLRPVLAEPRESGDHRRATSPSQVLASIRRALTDETAR